MTFEKRLAYFLNGILSTVFIVLVSSVCILQIASMMDDRSERIEIKKARQGEKDYIDWLNSLSFEDIVKYYKVIPPQKTVKPGSKAFFVSDSEILPVIEDIEGGVRVDWFESVLCDHKPYDGVDVFEFWREAKSTGSNYTQPVPRQTPKKLAAKKGFPVMEKRLEPFEGKIPQVLYPDHEANCRLRSMMVMNMRGAVKDFELFSEVVEIRE